MSSTEMHRIDPISNSLSIGSIRAAAEQSTAEFDVVISVCQDTREANIADPYEQYSLADSEHNAEHWGGTTEYDTFREAAESVVNHLRAGRSVLVHCHHGRNRSASVCIAALAVVHDLSYDVAEGILVMSRSLIAPSPTMADHAHRFINEHASPAES